MRNLRAQIAYDGSLFHGWQRQDGFASVQGAVEDAILSLTSRTVAVAGAGRTDTGVHALGQVASFHLDSRLDDARLLHALNAHLVPGVVLRRLETCREDFHARFDARAKRYIYRVSTGHFPPAFGRRYTHWLCDPLDLVAMRRAAAHLLGEHDFSSFASAGSPRSSNVRRLSAAHIIARRDAFLLALEASGFLYNMARAIAGTLLEVGRGRMSSEDLPGLVESRDRGQAGPTAPAEGLYMLAALYPEPVFRGRQRSARGVPGLFQY